MMEVKISVGFTGEGSRRREGGRQIHVTEVKQEMILQAKLSDKQTSL